MPLMLCNDILCSVLCYCTSSYVMVHHVGYILVILKMNQQNFEKVETAPIKPLQAPFYFMFVSYLYINLYSMDLRCMNQKKS